MIIEYKKYYNINPENELSPPSPQFKWRPPVCILIQTRSPRINCSAIKFDAVLYDSSDLPYTMFRVLADPFRVISKYRS